MEHWSNGKVQGPALVYSDFAIGFHDNRPYQKERAENKLAFLFFEIFAA